MKPLELMEQGRFLGEEFLLWLWMRSMTEGGASGGEGDGSGLFLDDQIQLATERGEVKQISLAKGNPSECREAFEALSRGMRPVKLKVRILSGDLEWVATLDAAQLRLSALKMPPSTGKAPHERLHDRIFLLEEGHGHLDRRFKQFLAERVDDAGEALAQALLAWVRAGLEGAAMPSGGAPWEGVPPAMPVDQWAASRMHGAVLGSESQAEGDAKGRIQGLLKDPKFEQSIVNCMDAMTKDGTTCTISMPGQAPVVIAPESAARAKAGLGGAP